MGAEQVTDNRADVLFGSSPFKTSSVGHLKLAGVSYAFFAGSNDRGTNVRRPDA